MNPPRPPTARAHSRLAAEEDGVKNDRLSTADGGHSGKRTARGVQRRRVCRGHNPAGPEPGHRRPGSAPADAGREASRSLAGLRCLCRQLRHRRDYLGQPPRTLQEHLRDRPDALVRQPPVAVLRRLHPVRHLYHRRLPAHRHRRCVAGRGAVSRGLYGRAGPVISPPTACVGPGGCQVEFTPWIVGLTPLAAFLVPDQRWQLDQDDEPTSWAELSIVLELASGATVGELVRGLAKAMLIAMGDRISAGRGGNHRRTPPGQLHPPGS